MVQCSHYFVSIIPRLRKSYPRNTFHRLMIRISRITLAGAITTVFCRTFSNSYHSVRSHVGDFFVRIRHLPVWAINSKSIYSNEPVIKNYAIFDVWLEPKILTGILCRLAVVSDWNVTWI